MKRFRSVIIALLAVLFFTVAMANPAFAENADGGGGGSSDITDGDLNTGLYPEEKTDKQSDRLFDRYPVGNYELVYIDNPEDLGGDSGKEDCSFYEVGCKAGNAATDAANLAFKAFFLITDGIWWLYLVIAKWLITVVSWGFTMQVLDYMFTAYSETLQGIQNTLWEPFKYLMWSVAVAWMVYYWITNKTTRLWSTFINSLLIIALSGTILSNLPNFIQSLSTTFTDVSALIMSGLSEDQEDDPTANQDESTSKAVDLMKDDLFNFAIVIPYKMVNFGSVPLSQKTIDGQDMRFWESVVSQDSYGKRQDKVIEFFKAEKDDASKEKYSWFTKEDVGTRLSFAALTFFASLACLLCFVMMAFYVIMWQLIALGRGLLTAIYFLLSLWPEWGLELALQHMWGVIQAEGMRLWYTLNLVVYLNLVIKLATHMEDDNIGMLSVWLIAFLLFLGLNHAMKELRQTLTAIPLGGGKSLAGATKEGEEMGNKVAGAAVMAAGAVTGTGALVGAGLALQQGGMGNVFKSAGLGAVSKVGNAMSGVRKTVTGAAGKGALAVVKGSGKLAGRAIKGGANWVDDALLHGKVKETSVTAADKAKDLVNKGIDKINKPLNKVGWRGIRTLSKDRLDRNDKQLIKDAKQIDGLDLSKHSDRIEYMNKHADQVDQVQKLEKYYNNTRRVARKLPKRLPPKNSPEYGKYVEQYGEQVLDSWTDAHLQQREFKRINRQRPLKERVKPKNFAGQSRFGNTDANIMRSFENNLGNKAANSSYKVPVQQIPLGKAGGALPTYVQAPLQAAITASLGANSGININTKEIADSIRQQLTGDIQRIMEGTTRGLKENLRVELKDSRNRRRDIKIPIAQLQENYARSNPIAVNMMQTAEVMNFAKSFSSSNTTEELSRVLSGFRNEMERAISHIRSGKNMDDYKGFTRLTRSNPELAGLDNKEIIQKVELMLNMKSGDFTGTLEEQIKRLEKLTNLLGDGMKSIKPPTPK
jgi:hypothetical protein